MSTTSDVTGDLESAAARVRELSEQVLSKAKENGLAWLEGYERLLTTMLDFEQQAAKNAGTEWAVTSWAAHADFVRQTSEVFLGSLKSQLRS
jgi:hypothetical protein